MDKKINIKMVIICVVIIVFSLLLIYVYLRFRRPELKFTLVDEQPYSMEKIESAYEKNDPELLPFCVPQCILVQKIEDNLDYYSLFDISDINLSNIDFSEKAVILSFGVPVKKICYSKIKVFPYTEDLLDCKETFIDVIEDEESAIEDKVYIYAFDNKDLYGINIYSGFNGFYYE